MPFKTATVRPAARVLAACGPTDDDQVIAVDKPVRIAGVLTCSFPPLPGAVSRDHAAIAKF